MRIVILFFCFHFTSGLIAQDVASLLKSAEENFEKEAYSESIEIYNQILDSGNSSSDLLFNLGLAHHKNSSLAEAKLYYLKCLKTTPSHKGAKGNLSLLELDRASEISPIPEFFLLQWWRQFSNFLSPTIWSFLLILSLLVSIYFFYQWLNVKPSKKTLLSSILALLIAIIILFASFTSNQLRKNIRHVLNLTVVDLHLSPDDKSKVEMSIPAGERMEIVDSLGNWKQVLLPNKEEGWIQTEQLKSI